MAHYYIEGYNSGGYRSNRSIEFDGAIEQLDQSDKFRYRYTYANGKTLEDSDELLRQLINEQNWNESFCPTSIRRKFNLPCVILAGGKSSRMGKDKALLPFGPYTTLAQYQYNKLSKYFASVYISCKDKTKFTFDANFIEDDTQTSWLQKLFFTNPMPPVYSPLIALNALFKYFGRQNFFLIAVDTPLVDFDDLIKLIDIEHYDAAIAKSDSGLHPLCATYSHTLKEQFKTALKNDQHKLHALLASARIKEVAIPESHLLNLNHPEEYQKALALI
jgi:molybdopterin-guanine dinucleotide biosynthesis protein A